MVHKDIPPGVTAVGIPARVVMPRNRKTASDFVAYGEPVDGCPDPVLRTIEDLRSQVVMLSGRIEELEGGRKKREYPAENKAVSKKSIGAAGKKGN